MRPCITIPDRPWNMTLLDLYITNQVGSYKWKVQKDSKRNARRFQQNVEEQTLLLICCSLIWNDSIVFLPMSCCPMMNVVIPDVITKADNYTHYLITRCLIPFLLIVSYQIVHSRGYVIITVILIRFFKIFKYNYWRRWPYIIIGSNDQIILFDIFKRGVGRVFWLSLMVNTNDHIIIYWWNVGRYRPRKAHVVSIYYRSVSWF